MSNKDNVEKLVETLIAIEYIPEYKKNVSKAKDLLRHVGKYIYKILTSYKYKRVKYKLKKKYIEIPGGMSDLRIYEDGTITYPGSRLITLEFIRHCLSYIWHAESDHFYTDSEIEELERVVKLLNKSDE